METVDSKHIHKNEVNKAYFQLTSAHGDLIDLLGKVASDKVLCHKVFNIAKNST